MHHLLGGIVGLLVLVFALLVFVFWLWMLIDAIKNPRLDGTMKIVWVLVIILFHGLGALIYFFAGRDRSLSG